MSRSLRKSSPKIVTTSLAPDSRAARRARFGLGGDTAVDQSIPKEASPESSPPVENPVVHEQAEKEDSKTNVMSTLMNKLKQRQQREQWTSSSVYPQNHLSTQVQPMQQSEDDYFVESVEVLLEGESDVLLHKDMDPIPYVAQILENDESTPLTYEKEEEEIALKLEVYDGKREDADRYLKQYITAHYDDFTASIQYFTEMILSVTTSQDTVMRLKKNISLATAGVTGHASELQDFKRRQKKNSIMMLVLKQVEFCMRAQKLIQTLIGRKHYLAAINYLISYRSFIQDSEIKSFRALGQTLDYFHSVQSTLSETVVDNLLTGIYRKDKLSLLRERMVRALTTPGGSFQKLAQQEPLITVTESPNLQQITDDDLLSSIDPSVNFISFIPMCVAALHKLRALEDTHVAFFSHSSKSIEECVCSFSKLFAVWFKEQVFSGLLTLHPDLNDSMTTSSSSSALTWWTQEKISNSQRTFVVSMFTVLIKELAKILRNVHYFTKVVLAVEFPFLAHVILTDSSIIQDTSRWNLDDFVFPDGEFLRLVLRGGEQQTYAKQQTANQTLGGAHDVAMKALWSQLAIDYFVKAYNPTVQPLTLIKLQAHFTSIAANVTSNYRHTCSAEVIQECLDLLLSEIKSALMSQAKQAVENTVAAWDPKIVWSHINYHLELLMLIVCQCNEAAGMERGGRNKNKSGLDGGKREYVGIAAVVQTFPSLSSLLQQKSSATHLPSFIAESGSVEFSLTQVAEVEKARWRAKEAMRNRLNVDLSSNKHRAVEAIEEALQPLEKHILRTVHNLIPLVSIMTSFVASCTQRMPELGRGSAQYTILTTLIRQLKSVFIPRLRMEVLQELEQQFASMNFSTGNDDLPKTSQGSSSESKKQLPSIDTYRHQTSPLPVLCGVYQVFLMAEKIINYSKELEILTPFGGAGVASPSFQLQRLADELIEETIIILKARIHLLLSGSFAEKYVWQHFDAAFSHHVTKDWMMMSNEENLFRTAETMDRELFAFYAAMNEHRSSAATTRPSASPQHNESEVTNCGAALGTIPVKELRIHSLAATAEIALICHSLEWLSDRYLIMNAAAHRHGRDSVVPFQSTCSVPGSKLILTQDKKRIFHDNVVAVYHQLISVSRAALFALAFDFRLAALGFFSQLRDECFNTVAGGTHPNTFVQEYTHHLSICVATVQPFLGALKLRYLLITLANPIANLFLTEVSFLRDKTLSSFGVAQLKVDILSVQHTLQAQLPLDAMVSQSVGDHFYRVREYFALLQNEDCVQYLIDSGLYTLYSDTELENLVSIVFRSDSDLMFRHILMLRNRLKRVRAEVEQDEKEEWVGTNEVTGEEKLVQPTEEAVGEKKKETSPVIIGPPSDTTSSGSESHSTSSSSTGSSSDEEDCR